VVLSGEIIEVGQRNAVAAQIGGKGQAP